MENNKATEPTNEPASPNKVIEFSPIATHNRGRLLGLIIKLKTMGSDSLQTAWPRPQTATLFKALIDYRRFLSEQDLHNSDEEIDMAIRMEVGSHESDSHYQIDVESIVEDIRSSITDQHWLRVEIKRAQSNEWDIFEFAPEQSDWTLSLIANVLVDFDDQGNFIAHDGATH